MFRECVTLGGKVTVYVMRFAFGCEVWSHTFESYDRTEIEER